jgi:hypothetical protein
MNSFEFGTRFVLFWYSFVVGASSRGGNTGLPNLPFPSSNFNTTNLSITSTFSPFPLLNSRPHQNSPYHCF